MPNKDYHHLRENYADKLLRKDELHQDPIEQLGLWLKEAKEQNIVDPNAMCLCTRGENGIFRQRQVLLKEIFEGKIVFYTNYTSQKAMDIAHDPNVSVNFFWRDLFRQITISGKADKVSQEHSKAYFQKRPRNSQIAAWASKQSSVLVDRSELTDRFNTIENKFKDKDIPLPEFWGGYAITPIRFEFWQGVQDRMHDRFEYLLNGNNWIINRLSP